MGQSRKNQPRLAEKSGSHLTARVGNVVVVVYWPRERGRQKRVGIGCRRFVPGVSIIYPLIRNEEPKSEVITLSEFSHPAAFSVVIREARVGFHLSPKMNEVT
jgi:hypothetical protein